MKKVYLFATIMAIITAITMYFFANTLQENSKKSKMQTSRVVVAAVDIKENTVITDKMVMIKEIATDSVTDGAVGNLKDVVNKVTKYQIITGEQIVLKKLAQAENEKAGELALMLPNGNRAITVNVTELTGVAGYINKGDHVDLITSDNGKPIMIAENIKVIKLGLYDEDKAGDVNKYTLVTLDATLQQAINIDQAVSKGLPIRLLLRSTLDDKPTGLPLFDYNK